MKVREFMDILRTASPDADVKLSTYSCGTTSTYDYSADRVRIDRAGNVILEAEDN